MAAVRSREGTPPPVIGKAGRYTVFITPPAGTPSHSPKTPLPTVASPKLSSSPPSPLAVQVPPPQFEKPKAPSFHSGALGFFWDAVARVQDVHARVDGCLAEWLGLDKSRYHWALSDYYDEASKMVEKGGGKQKEAPKAMGKDGEIV